MTTFRIKPHLITGRQMIEIVDDNADVVGAIYPTQDGSNMIHIVSNYFTDDPIRPSTGGISTPGYLIAFKSP